MRVYSTGFVEFPYNAEDEKAAEKEIQDLTPGSEGYLEKIHASIRSTAPSAQELAEH